MVNLASLIGQAVHSLECSQVGKGECSQLGAYAYSQLVEGSVHSLDLSYLGEGDGEFEVATEAGAQQAV